MEKKFVLKEEVNLEDLTFISSNLLLLFTNFCLYAQKNLLPVKVTSIIDTLERATTTHLEGRAMDISVKEWPDRNIKELEREFNKEFKNIAAVSRSDNIKRAVLVHDVGMGKHFHLQTKS